MSNDLRLNTIDRFRKTSERLVLEEHGSCEVPAGCGGVVLRWFNPDAGVPVIFRAGFTSQLEIFLDGEPIPSSRVTIPFGEHVVSLRCRHAPGELPGLWLAGQRDLAGNYEEEDVILPDLTTSTDGTWLAVFAEPQEGEWTALEFDDSQWQSPPVLTLDPEQIAQEQRWQYRSMENCGAVAFDLSAHAAVWIRKRFTMVR